MSTSEESASIQSKQSEPAPSLIEESAPSATEPVEATPSPSDSEPTTARKRKKGAAVQLDEEGNPIKKTRAPFVYTEKRKLAFELCRQKRAETLAKKREAEKEVKEAQKEVRSKMRELRGMMYKDTDPNLIKSSLSNTLHSVQQMSSQTNTTSEPDLTQEMEQEVPSAPTQVLPPRPAEQREQAAPAPAVMRRPTATKRPFEQEEQDDEAYNAVQSLGSMQVEERKVVRFAGPPPRMGTGAGNHEPYEGEPGYGMQQSDNECEAEEPAQMSDAEVAALYEQARFEAERRGIFNQRRENVKMMRPSHASMFLDHAYVHSQSLHPSQLRGSTQGSSGGAGAGSSGFIWM